MQQAARIAPQSNILEDYNPFEDDNRHTTIPIGQQQQQPQPQRKEPFPAYNQNSQTNSAYGKAAPQISTEELQVFVNNNNLGLENFVKLLREINGSKYFHTK